MNNYTAGNHEIQVETESMVQGWELVHEGLETFKEAPLLLDDALGRISRRDFHCIDFGSGCSR